MNRKSRLYHFFKKCEQPPNHNYFWTGMSLLYNIGMVLIGRLVFIKECNKRTSYILMAPFSIGDVLLFYRSMDEMVKANNINSPVIIAEQHLSTALIALSINNYKTLSSWKIIALSKALLFSPEKYNNLKLSQPWHFFDIRDMNTATNLNAIPCFLSEKSKKLLFPEQSTTKYIILSPYEQTYIGRGEPQLPMSFWNKLAVEFRKLNYIVFTNCDGKKDKPIDGTKIFFPQLNELAGAVEYAGNCISVRSGFSDWISSAKTAKQVILYPSESFYNEFRMDAVWQRTDIIELIYDLKHLPQFQNQLLEYFMEI